MKLAVSMQIQDCRKVLRDHNDDTTIYVTRCSEANKYLLQVSSHTLIHTNVIGIDSQNFIVKMLLLQLLNLLQNI